MGKLLEALKKQLQALEQHKNTPRPDHVTDPAGAYAHLEKEKRLAYKRALMCQGLNEAFSRLKPEQRAAFYQQSVNPRRRSRMAQAEFERRSVAANNARDQEQALRAFLLNDDSFGCPWRTVLPIMEALLRENHQADEIQALAGASDEERALGYFRHMSTVMRFDLFRQAVTPERKHRYEADYIEHLTAENKLEGQLLGDNFYGEGKSWQQGIEQLETLLAPQELEQIAAGFDNIPDPEQGDKLVSPEQARLEELRAQAAEDPKKLALIDRAAEILRYPSNAYLGYLDSKSRDADSMADDIQKHGLEQYLDGHENGILKGKLRDTKGPGARFATYNPVDVTPRYRNEMGQVELGVELTEPELNALNQGGSLPVAADAKQAMLDIIAGFEAIGEKSYWIPEAADILSGSLENPTKVRYLSEQGDKKYAFWPLVKAKEALRKAVRERDWAGIETHSAEYQRIKAITDRMMETARKANALPVFPGNVNSTRVDRDNQLNPMPTEYLEDYTAHSRVNGAFVLYAVCKNLGVSPADMLDNPGQVFRRQAEQFMQSRMLHSFRQESAGARLAKSLNSELQLAAEQEWSRTLTGLNRGGDALASLCAKKEDRETAIGRNFSALASANYAVGLETRPWRAMAFANPERKALIARMALLLPEEQLDLKALGLKLLQPDWEKTLNPTAEIKRLRKAGQLNYAAITARSRQMVQDAIDAEAELHGGQKAIFYQKAALQNYRYLLQSAPQAERETAGFKAMAAHAAELQEQAVRHFMHDNFVGYGSFLSGFNQEYQVLDRDKSGWFLSTQNSPEYERMMKGVRRFKAKLDLLAGIEPQGMNQEELEQLRQSDCAELYQQARRGCMDYLCEKTNYGNDVILHSAGRVRRQAAMNMAKLLGSLADGCSLRSPAMALKENTELEVLSKRGSQRWQSRNGELSAAKALCGIYLEQQGVSWERQARLLSQQKLPDALNEIRSRPQFRRMAKDLQSNGLCGMVVRGASALAGAYNKAGEELRREQTRRAPKLQPQIAPEEHQL